MNVLEQGDSGSPFNRKIMDYEKMYKEALERAKKLTSDMTTLQEIREFIFPELSESEDERIRKEIMAFIQWAIDRGSITKELRERSDAWFAWLEKQKENPKSADSIPSDCASDAKCEDRWHKVSDSLPDNPREVLCKDEAGNFFIGRYYTGEGWEISNYDDEDKPHHLNPPVSKWIDFPSEKQKEQKLNIELIQRSWYMEGYTDGEFKREPMWNLVTGKGGPKSELNPKYGQPLEQKPAEWSEEDVDMLNSCISSIEEAKENRYAYKETDGDTSYDHEIAWLKSLRPQYHGDVTMTEAYKMGLEAGKASSWKPSEEQMAALEAATVRYQSTGLESLYEDLKKL